MYMFSCWIGYTLHPTLIYELCAEFATDPEIVYIVNRIHVLICGASCNTGHVPPLALQDCARYTRLYVEQFDAKAM